jgi:hypothetical protein
MKKIKNWFLGQNNIYTSLGKREFTSLVTQNTEATSSKRKLRKYGKLIFTFIANRFYTRLKIININKYKCDFYIIVWACEAPSSGKYLRLSPLDF